MTYQILDCPNYRGFMLGYQIGPNGIHAAWKSSLEDNWTFSNVLVDDVSEVDKLAKECIDFYYRQHAKEAILGRELTMEELKELHYKD